MKVKAKKDLVNDLGQKNFTKGNIYEGRDVSLLEHLQVKDDQDDDHLLGNWSKYFTVLKK